MTGDHVCIPLFDDAGHVVGHAQVAPGLTEEDRRALGALIVAAKQLMAEEGAADPEAAAERGRRQAAAIARVRGRAGLRGGE